MSKTETPAPVQASGGVRIFEGKLHRVQRGHSKVFAGGPPAAPPEPDRRPARVAVMLALAHKIQEAIDSGVLRDRAEAARRLGLTRARVTQLMDLTLLAADVQERMLCAEAADGVEPISERWLRAVVKADAWADQRAFCRSAGRVGAPRRLASLCQPCRGRERDPLRPCF